MNRTKRTSERMFSFFVGRRDMRTATGALHPGNDMVFFIGSSHTKVSLDSRGKK